jgi:lambda family phage portal protein
MPSPLSSLRHKLARLIAGPAPARGAQRSYSAARATRTTGGFGTSTSSADSELHQDLTRLRNRSRALVRDSAYAKRARNIIVNNVVGTGVGLQAQVITSRGELNERINASIEGAWREWCKADACHTGGTLHFADLERAALGQVFEAGEVLVRMHFRRFGASRVPLSLELIEAERMADEFSQPANTGGLPQGHELRLGVEVDSFGRPVAYYIRERHQGDVRFSMAGMPDRFERVPADEIFHLRVVTRWPQTRGEPWMHTVVRKIDDLNEYSQLEVSAARAAAAYFATIETADLENPLVDKVEDDGAPVMSIDPLTIQELAPGEKLQFHTPNRPNAAFDAFVRSLLREVAAGCSVSYESLSRDYSQGNYSSSRMGMLDDRDGFRTLQKWWVRSFRQGLHQVWLQQAVLAGAVPGVSVEAYALNRERYSAAAFRCRGWSWVDPTKEVAAYKEAVKAGFITVAGVIEQTGNGMDLEDYLRERRRELDAMEAAGVKVDTTVADASVFGAGQPSRPSAADNENEDAADEDDASTAPGRVLPIRKTA